MSAIRSWKLVVAGVAASVVVAGGVGMTVLQLRAGDANESGPPNIDTRTWVSERSDAGWLIRRPREWTYRPFNSLVGNRVSYTGATVSNEPCEGPRSEESPVDFCGRPDVLAGVRIVQVAGGPSRLVNEPDTHFPLALEAATRDPAERSGHVMLHLPFVVDRRSGWEVNVWIGNKASTRDAEIVRRIVSSFGFEGPAVPGALTLEEQMIAHEIAESYRGARTALKGRPHTHTELATDQTGSGKCGSHRCGLVVFQITGGLRFRVLVDLTERRAVAFS